MPRCELCGSEQSELTAALVAHAELDVCDSCASLGTPLDSDEDEAESDTDSKYSTSSGSTDDTSDPVIPEMGRTLVDDYSDRIRRGREQSRLTVDELADRLNEKASYLQKIERGDLVPNTTVQVQLEQFLDIELTVDE